MKNKNTLLVIVLGFVLLLGGAYVLYDRLGQDVTAEQMIVHATPQPTPEPAAEEVIPEGESTEAADTSANEEPEDIIAPDFEVIDKEGNPVKLSSFFGKPIVLNFWASWCGPCQSEMPDFNKKYLEHGDEVVFLMVNLTVGRETVSSASSFISKNGYSFPVYYDTKSSAANAYNIYSIPTTFFIDAEGYLVAQATGAINAETLQKGIDMIT